MALSIDSLKLRSAQTSTDTSVLSSSSTTDTEEQQSTSSSSSVSQGGIEATFTDTAGNVFDADTGQLKQAAANNSSAIRAGGASDAAVRAASLSGNQESDGFSRSGGDRERSLKLSALREA